MTTPPERPEPEPASRATEPVAHASAAPNPAAAPDPAAAPSPSSGPGYSPAEAAPVPWARPAAEAQPVLAGQPVSGTPAFGQPAFAAQGGFAPYPQQGQPQPGQPQPGQPQLGQPQLGQPLQGPGWPAPAPGPEGAQKRRVPLLAAGLAGLLLGGLIVGVVWAAAGGHHGTGAAADAGAACDIFARLPGTWENETITKANADRLGAAAALADAAAQDDSKYSLLASQSALADRALITFDTTNLALQVKTVNNTCDRL